MSAFEQITVLDGQPSNAGERQALLEHKAFIRFESSTIEMRGKDVNDFLQRVSTNDFTHFSKGEILPTIFLTEKGRVIDLVYAIHQGDSVLLLISVGAEEKVIEWINKFIIMDDVTLMRSETAPTIFLVLADDIITDKASSQYRITAFGLNFSLFLVYNGVSKFITELETNGLTCVSGKNWEEFRISNGIPQYNKELQEKFNPLELNLWELISFTKGCYIGQEVIARLETYNKVQRKLCLLSIDGDLDSQRRLISESTKEESGILTSVCKKSDAVGVSLGLAVLKNNYAIEGESLIVQGSNLKSNVLKVFPKK
jgi:folate-binding protein YgfZ